MAELRLLVVDDEPGIRHGIARALRSFRTALPGVDPDITFDVSGVESGEAALVAIAADPPDIVMLDYKMPGMSGLEVLEKLGDESRDMLVIMITAFATIETAVRATKRGAFDFIAKPFTPSELKHTLEKSVSSLLHGRQARRLAEEKKRVRFEFIRVLGHELKAPLGAVDQYLELMKQHALGDEMEKYDHVVERCRTRTDGMRKLIADLLDLTRIESGEKARTLTCVNVSAVARRVIETHELAAEEREINVALDAPEQAMLTADEGELEIVINNLVSNAIKYNRAGGQVDVAIAHDGDELRIVVRDTGIGLEPNDAARLFNDFVRIKNEATRDILGSGLGLSTVKKIAELYGGRATVDSIPGEGSTFTVKLREQTAADGGSTGAAEADQEPTVETGATA